LPALAVVLAQPAALPIMAVPMLPGVGTLPAPAGFGPTTAQIDSNGLSGSPASPIPAQPGSPGRPGDHSTSGHVRDAGGGSAPTMGTVPSFWRPGFVAAGFDSPGDLTVYGRTVRYAGPPS
jgi:hypothetical protein